MFLRKSHKSILEMDLFFAEKLETIIHRGSFNSRMKDFHDLYSLISSTRLLSFSDLEKTIGLVFEHRATPLMLPLTYTKDELGQIQKFWDAYLKNLRNAEHLPTAFDQVIAAINKWLHLNTRLIR